MKHLIGGVARGRVAGSRVAGGLLAGALSMGAGEFVSVRSQRELLAATEPNNDADHVLPDLDLDANELALVYRTRGMSAADADARARSVVGAAREADRSVPFRLADEDADAHDVIGRDWGAAVSSSELATTSGVQSTCRSCSASIKPCAWRRCAKLAIAPSIGEPERPGSKRAGLRTSTTRASSSFGSSVERSRAK